MASLSASPPSKPERQRRTETQISRPAIFTAAAFTVADEAATHCGPPDDEPEELRVQLRRGTFLQ